MTQAALPYTDRFEAGFAIREYRLPAGSELETHAHDYDHMSVLLSGDVLLDCDGVSRALKGPCMVEIKAGVRHRLSVLTDSRWDCVRSFEQAKLEGLLCPSS